MKTLTATLALGLALSPLAAHATSINVLWTSGTTEYNDNITELAGEASTYDPASDGALDWNLTFWNGAAVDFTAYDVLVVGSTYGVNQNHSSGVGGSTGFFGLGVSAQGVLDNSAAIASARGNRTFLSGQDADWHDLNNRQDQPNGPAGFMINAVNWAASGTGLGIVSMVDRYVNGTAAGIGWWDNPASFLFDELVDGGLSAAFAHQSDTVNIGPGQDSFPINEGLTSAGLSGWATSAHACFGAIDGYTAINIAGAGTDPGCGVTIVTTSNAGGDTGGGDTPTPAVPLPAGAVLLVSALGALAVRRRKA